MTIHDSNLERLQDLLAARATCGLADVAEEQELDELMDSVGDGDENGLDWAAAAVAMALEESEPAELPGSVRDRIETTAIGWLAEQHGMRLAGTAAVASAPTRRSPMVFAPWLVAAACIVIAAVVLWPAPTPTAQRLLMIADGTPALPWTDAVGQGVGGDVVWSQATQSGVIRFTNLPVNDPTKMQYQLWIFDGERAEPFNAVDGGVFDVTRAGAETVVAIDAKLKVSEATLFAITTEPPGGVVKHDPTLDPEQFRIILTAAPTAG